MNFKEFTAGKDDANRRLDKVIRHFLPDISLSEIYKLLRKGLIKVNSKKCDQAYKVQSGDVIKVPVFLLINSNNDEDKPKANIQLPPLPPVVFENQHLLILNKPYDMLVHGSSMSLDEIVKKYYSQNFSKSSLSFKPGPLHRLDRKTTGLIAFSMSLEGAQWFTENIKNHTITKKYFGITENWLQKEEIWEDFIEKDSESESGFHKVNISSEKISDGKIAYTKVVPILNTMYKYKKISLVSFNIETGRTHQIRSQCQLHGYSLLGDDAYGSQKLSGTKQTHYLQAYEMCFPPQNPLNLPEKIKIDINPAFKEIIKEIEI